MGARSSEAKGRKLAEFIQEVVNSLRFQQFCQEALLWCQLTHQNILPFLGLYQSGPQETIMMVSPLMYNGNILKYLKMMPKADRYQLVSCSTNSQLINFLIMFTYSSYMHPRD